MRFYICVSSMHIYYFLCMQNFEAIMCRSWYVFPVPDLGLWRPLGNNVIEKSSTSWSYQLKAKI